MGNSESSSASESVLDGNINPEYLKKLHEQGIKFTSQEIIHLVNKYRELAGTEDLGGDGRIDEDEFVTKMKIPNEKIGKIMYKMLDSDGNGTLDFNEFITGLNNFLPDAPIEEKAKLCFRAYDSDGSGTISKDEIRSMIEISLENNQLMSMDDEHLDKLISDVFEEYDKDGTGEISEDEFLEMMKKAPNVLDIFEIDVAALISE